MDIFLIPEKYIVYFLSSNTYRHCVNTIVMESLRNLALLDFKCKKYSISKDPFWGILLSVIYVKEILIMWPSK